MLSQGGNEVHSLPTSLDREFTSNVCKVPEGENIIDIGCAEADVYFSTGIIALRYRSLNLHPYIDVGSVYHSNRQKMKRVSIPEDLPITKLETRGSVVTLLAGKPNYIKEEQMNDDNLNNRTPKMDIQNTSAVSQTIQRTGENSSTMRTNWTRSITSTSRMRIMAASKRTPVPCHSSAC